MKFLSFLLFLYSAFANSQTVYITEQVEIPFRSDPSIKSDNVIKRLESGVMLELVRFKDGWAEVRYQGKTGWIIGRYLSFESPAKFQLGQLKNEIKYLQSVITQLKNQNPDISIAKSNEINLECSYSEKDSMGKGPFNIHINKSLGTGTSRLGQGALVTSADSYQFSVPRSWGVMTYIIDRNDLSIRESTGSAVGSKGSCVVMENKTRI